MQNGPDNSKRRIESSDRGLIEVLRREGGLRVAQLAKRMGVTATAVRQRLVRLTSDGLIERVAIRSETPERGRPSYMYQLSDQGRKQAGSSLPDLAVALWDEVRAIKDVEVRRGLLKRIANRLAGVFDSGIEGTTAATKMESLANFLSDRDIPFGVEQQNELPVLKAYACPYTELAERDRSVCSMERMMFAELLGEDLRLSGCRLDGESCCTFELS